MGWIAERLSRRAAARQIRLKVRASAVRRAEALANPTASPAQRLLHWWGRAPAAPASAPQLGLLEKRYGITLPHDFRAYLEAAMPEGNEWDDEGTRWFPLADIRSVREECAEWDSRSALDSDKLLVFADYLIWCYAWAVDCSDTENRGKVALITGSDHYVADSFDAFIDRYLLDDPALHH